jgi:hypothetical protein
MNGEAVAPKVLTPSSVDSESAQSGSMDAEAIAVRAIARYNIERRRAGEPPLDLKGIERLRHILTEAIAREIQRDSGPADPH